MSDMNKEKKAIDKMFEDGIIEKKSIKSQYDANQAFKKMISEDKPKELYTVDYFAKQKKQVNEDECDVVKDDEVVEPELDVVPDVVPDVVDDLDPMGIVVSDDMDVVELEALHAKLDQMFQAAQEKKDLEAKMAEIMGIIASKTDPVPEEPCVQTPPVELEVPALEDECNVVGEDRVVVADTITEADPNLDEPVIEPEDDINQLDVDATDDVVTDEPIDEPIIDEPDISDVGDISKSGTTDMIENLFVLGILKTGPQFKEYATEKMKDALLKQGMSEEQYEQVGKAFFDLDTTTSLLENKE